jgi:hypothetical protein
MNLILDVFDCEVPFERQFKHWRWIHSSIFNWYWWNKLNNWLVLESGFRDWLGTIKLFLIEDNCLVFNRDLAYILDLILHILDLFSWWNRYNNFLNRIYSLIQHNELLRWFIFKYDRWTVLDFVVRNLFQITKLLPIEQ